MSEQMRLYRPTLVVRVHSGVPMRKKEIPLHLDVLLLMDEYIHHQLYWHSLCHLPQPKDEGRRNGIVQGTEQNISRTFCKYKLSKFDINVQIEGY